MDIFAVFGVVNAEDVYKNAHPQRWLQYFFIHPVLKLPIQKRGGRVSGKDLARDQDAVYFSLVIPYNRSVHGKLNNKNLIISVDTEYLMSPVPVGKC